MDTANKLAGELRETAAWLREQSEVVQSLWVRRSSEAPQAATVARLQGRAGLLETIASEAPETHPASAGPHPHTACLLQILDETEDYPVRCMADLQAVLGRVRHLAAAALGETLPEES